MSLAVLLAAASCDHVNKWTGSGRETITRLYTAMPTDMIVYRSNFRSETGGRAHSCTLQATKVLSWNYIGVLLFVPYLPATSSWWATHFRSFLFVWPRQFRESLFLPSDQRSISWCWMLKLLYEVCGERTSLQTRSKSRFNFVSVRINQLALRKPSGPSQGIRKGGHSIRRWETSFLIHPRARGPEI